MNLHQSYIVESQETASRHSNWAMVDRKDTLEGARRSKVAMEEWSRRNFPGMYLYRISFEKSFTEVVDD